MTNLIVQDLWTKPIEVAKFLKLDLGWLLLEVSMGSIFDGALDTAVVVPESWKQGC